MPWKLQGFLTLTALAATLGCRTPEAEDPHAILGEEAEYRGVDGTTGARGTKESRSPGTPPSEAGPVATRTECHAAARRIEELALDLAIKEEDDTNVRAQLESKKQEELKSSGFKARVTQAANDCVARDTTAREARCIAKARSELDIDRCGSK